MRPAPRCLTVKAEVNAPHVPLQPHPKQDVRAAQSLAVHPCPETASLAAPALLTTPCKGGPWAALFRSQMHPEVMPIHDTEQGPEALPERESGMVHQRRAGSNTPHVGRMRRAQRKEHCLAKAGAAGSTPAGCMQDLLRAGADPVIASNATGRGFESRSVVLSGRPVAQLAEQFAGRTTRPQHRLRPQPCLLATGQSDTGYRGSADRGFEPRPAVPADSR